LSTRRRSMFSLIAQPTIHLFGQGPVRLVPLGLRALLPGVVARARHAQLLAHEVDGETGPLRTAALELHFEVSFAKKAAAFSGSRAPSPDGAPPCAGDAACGRAPPAGRGGSAARHTAAPPPASPGAGGAEVVASAGDASTHWSC